VRVGHQTVELWASLLCAADADVHVLRKLRVPGTGKRVFRSRPESEWVTVDAPHLRIVSTEAFAAVARRFETVKRVFARDGSGLAIGQKRYLFSGLLKCGECGGSIVLVCGRGRHGADRYGCSLHHQRGDSVCSNALLVRRDDLEERLLQRLSDTVLREEVIDYAIAGVAEELEKRFESLNSRLTSSLLQPLVGLYSDRHPKPYFLAAGMGITLTGLLTLSLSSTSTRVR
jgi:Recombinase zinc beta ribbon domain